MFKLLFLINFLIKLATSKEICYHDADLGCFTDTKPFGGTLQRPIAFLPETPEKIATKFTLFNNENPSGIVIDSNVFNEAFNDELKTKFIIHGFVHNGNKEWVIGIKSKILRYDSSNVIVVDWSGGNGLPYTQATANTQVVGREMGKLIDFLCENSNTTAEDFHLIGHSLGAHISGYAGYYLKTRYRKTLGRITGLDAAGPYFENTEPLVRLDPTDAEFVDAIHTDGTATLQVGLGLFQAIGHADFYPNGGVNQPDCPQTSDKLLNALFSLASLSVAGVEDGVACSHTAAIFYFSDSIANRCKYLSYRCESKEDFDSGKCIECSDRGCNQMGYWADKKKDDGKLFLDTQTPNKNSKYCLHNYRVTLHSNEINGILQTRGLFKIFFTTKNHQSDVHVLDNSAITFKKNSIETRLISLDDSYDEEEISDVFISFDRTSNLASYWLYNDKWSFRYIEIFTGDTQLEEKFCPYQPLIQSGSTVRFTRC